MSCNVEQTHAYIFVHSGKVIRKGSKGNMEYVLSSEPHLVLFLHDFALVNDGFFAKPISASRAMVDCLNRSWIDEKNSC